ncbi:MAG: YggT family protein [Acidimicrobiales bacterium]
MTNLIVMLLNLVVLLLVVRVILSWVRLGPDSQFRPVVDVVYRLTEPILAPIRRVLPAMGGFDLSPLLVIIAIRLVQGAI